MAKPYKNTNKSVFKNEYNIDEVLVTKTDIMEYLKNYQDDGQHAVAFGVKKTPRDTMPSWFKTWSETFETKINDRFKKIETRLDNIEIRIDNIVKLNNLKE